MTGAERAQSDEAFAPSPARAEADWIGTAPEEPQVQLALEEQPAPPRSTGVKLFGALLALLALGWTAAAGWTAWQARAGADLASAVAAITGLSGPLVLLALLWLWLGRTPRREAERFTRAVEEMRAESTALESVLSIVAARIEENHARLRGEAERLMTLGDEAADRLGRVTFYLSKETAGLDRTAAALDSAASSAKVDIGVLLHDLPRAEEQARAVAEAMKDAGIAAHTHAGALEAQLAALTSKGREADELLGGAAQRLSAHVARIETGSAAAAASMADASAGMTAAVDAAMARSSEAIDASRAALDAQGAALLAAIEQSRAALDSAGDDAARNLSQRLQSLSDRMEDLGSRLAAQDAASHALVTGLAKELAELDDWFEQLGRKGGAESQRLAAAVTAVRDSTRSLIEEMTAGRGEAAALVERGREIADVLGGVGQQLDSALPAALAAVETQAERAGAALAGLAPAAAEVQASAEAIAAEVEQVRARAAEVAALLERHDARSRELVAALAGDVDALRQRFEAAGGAGSEQAAALSRTIAQLREATAALDSELAGQDDRIGSVGGRADALCAAVGGLAAQLGEALPEALARLEAQAEQSRDAAAALAPVVAGVEQSAGAAAARIGEAEAAIGRQRAALDALLARIDEGADGAEEKLRALGAAALEAQQAAARIVAETSPELVEAMVRVRETASQAAERAREAIAAVIPASAAALGEAGRTALTEAISATVERQMAELAAVSERALRAARDASERLTRQMLTIGETAAAVETRIEAARKEREAKESENFSRRVALLIESLNSTAIDVTKILSNEVTDSAWAAYLKGDRGVFTRRAVRLLDTAEAREIARHYEEEPEFREQVNRYIHDFEAMLRRILADRDGSPLGVTILSSDMGKLYVALAQAIERLRK